MQGLIAGWLYDATDVYAWSFYLGGAALISSGLAAIAPLVVNQITNRKSVVPENGAPDL